MKKDNEKAEKKTSVLAEALSFGQIDSTSAMEHEWT